MFDNKEKYLNNFSYKPTKNQIEFLSISTNFFKILPNLKYSSFRAMRNWENKRCKCLSEDTSQYEKEECFTGLWKGCKSFVAIYAEKSFTIHKKIYTLSLETDTFTPSENNHKNTLFVVDEASMIPHIKPVVVGNFRI